MATIQVQGVHHITLVGSTRADYQAGLETETLLKALEPVNATA